VCGGCGLLIHDFCGNAERRISAASRMPLDEEDEATAAKIVTLQQGLQVGSENEHKLREIGLRLGADGGTYRMKRMAYRVAALGGSLRLLEHIWADIRGWQA
jgi:hypothetical protein